ncbi:hypothetical protein ACH5RR_019117 [Cinchona calisaya]|uniref:Uncharacterized protein n=1 Tax=Cinchona calisaya TaxID=153742 RepID=A0ABD2ZTL1_9GENT
MKSLYCYFLSFLLIQELQLPLQLRCVAVLTTDPAASSEGHQLPYGLMKAEEMQSIRLMRSLPSPPPPPQPDQPNHWRRAIPGTPSAKAPSVPAPPPPS